ncbi:MAG: patatin-like protein [Pseudomonadota bacterium]
MGETADNQAGKSRRRSLELRMALVCYGGVSLAVYMHGVSREILNLVKASKAVRDHMGGRTDVPSQFVYETLLDTIHDTVDLRVVVDIIAGASAGGINGIMLSRALAYDLPLDSHRKMWLELGDVTELLDPKGKANMWSKPFMRPMLAFLGWWQKKGMGQLASDAARSLEVQQKLSLLTRSRWFHPPFSGDRMSKMMLDGLTSIGLDGASKGSLLPSGHPLDLFVTGTDFWGHRQLLALHDPPVIVEREHRHILTFRHVTMADGMAQSEMTEQDIPSMAFAARATSCFPGAFPPAQLKEIDRVLAAEGKEWTNRKAFIDRSFKALTAQGEDVEDAAFIDGSVLMNKPLALAIKAVQDRSASREVDRRIVYIDPNPDKRARIQSDPPGFFSTLKGALSDIPRNQPIRDDLEWLNTFNIRAENLNQIINALTPKVTRMVSGIRKGLWGRDLTLERLGVWRKKAHSAAAEDSGFAYGAYARLKVLTVLEETAFLINISGNSTQEDSVRTQLDEWAYRQDVLPISDAADDALSKDDTPWVEFLRQYDVHYRVRRMRFMLRRVNDLYRGLSFDDALQASWLNRAKVALYDIIHRYEAVARLENLPGAQGVFFPPSGQASKDDIDAFLSKVGGYLDLQILDESFDILLVELFNDAPSKEMATQVLDCYLGFAFFDVATLPMTQWRDLYELDEVLVDRISANDANSLDRGGAGQILKGAELGNFGAFFSRAYRENDYLWGRLTGAERLIDIVASAVPDLADALPISKLKQQMFAAILDEEEPHLTHIPDIFIDLRKRVSSMV